MSEEALQCQLLEKIQGEIIAQAGRLLPVATENSPAMVQSASEVPGLGMVTFSFKLMKHKHGKSVNYFWTACRAEKC